MRKLLMMSSFLVAVPIAAMAQQAMQSGSADGMQYQYLVSPGGCSTAAPCQIIEYLHWLGGENYVQDDLNTYFNTPAFWAAHPDTVVVAPQINGSSDTNNWGGVQSGVSPNAQAAVAVVQQVEAQMPTNPNSVVLTGGSMGGIGTEAMMEEYGPKGTTGQHIYAAGLAYDGALYNSDPATEQAALCGVPLIVQHGSADTTVLPTYDEQLAQTLSGCAGFQYVEIPGAGHGTWGDSYTALTQLSEMTTAAAAAGSTATPPAATAAAGSAASGGTGGALVPQNSLTSTTASASTAPSGASSATPHASSGASNASTTPSTSSTPTSTASASPSTASSSTALQDVQIADDAVQLAEAEAASPSPNTQLMASLLTEAGSRLDAAQGLLGSASGTTLAPTASPPNAPVVNTTPPVTVCSKGSAGCSPPSTHSSNTSTSTPTPSTNTPAPTTNAPNVAVPAVTATACDLASSGQFAAMGNTVYGPNQTPFVARGIDIMQGQDPSLAEVQSAFPGINFIRYAIYNYTDPATLNAYISQFTNAGIVVELEDHQTSDGTDAGGQSGQVFTGQQLSTELAWYTSVASYFKNNPYVWYGTDNEPAVSPSLSALSDWQEQTYNAIRGTGNNAPIMLESIVTTSDPSGINQGLQQSDYSNMTNTIWDVHFYPWIVNNSTDQSTVDQGLAAAASAAQSITNAGGVMPVLIGEYGNSGDNLSIAPDGPQVVTAVNTSGFGSAAWDWGESGGPADSLTDGDTPTSPFGQQVAQYIAAGGTTTGASLAQTCGTAISSTAAAPATTPTPQNSLSSIAAPAGMN